METIVLCIHSDGDCCVREECPLIKKCFPDAKKVAPAANYNGENHE